MKKYIIALTLAAVVAVGLSGCATTGNQPSPDITPERLEKTTILLKGSVRAGLLLVIEKNATAKDYVCLAGETLNLVLSTSTDYTPGTLEARLYKLPVKDLKKAEVQLAVSTILTAYEIYYADYVAGRVNGNQVAKALLTALRDGAQGACAFAEGGQ